MSALKDCHIIDNENSVMVTIFESLLGGDFRAVVYDSPRHYIQQYWNAYTCLPNRNPSLNGKIFELIIYTLLYREQIVPFYTQAKVAFVPNIEFDTILYSKNNPVSISIKTSLRERYKQADLEAIALKYVHRKAKCFLLTLEHQEAQRVKHHIQEGAVIGIDDIIDCTSVEIDHFIQDLKNNKEYNFTLSEQIETVSGHLINR